MSVANIMGANGIILSQFLPFGGEGGSTGPTGPSGGPTGPVGPTGQGTGATGPVGPVGPAGGSLLYANFYRIGPGQVSAGQFILLDGPVGGAPDQPPAPSVGITKNDSTTSPLNGGAPAGTAITLSSIGVYEVAFYCSYTSLSGSAGPLTPCIAFGPTLGAIEYIQFTDGHVVSPVSGTYIEVSGTFLLNATQLNSVVALINSSQSTGGNSQLLLGSDSVCSLVIKQIA